MENDILNNDGKPFIDKVQEAYQKGFRSNPDYRIAARFISAKAKEVANDKERKDFEHGNIDKNRSDRESDDLELV